MNRTITRVVLFCFIFCISITSLIAQSIKVSGEVVSGDDRQPIPGVAVRIKGGQTGTITDGNGRFTVSVEPGATLEFISLGYTAEEKLVEGTSFLKISLKVEAKQLKEVVIGYGKQERRKMVGSVATVNAKALENVPTTSFEQNLQGRVAGVQLSTQGGVVGSASRIRIRGGGQIGGTGEPLFVIDGIILDQGANGTSDYSSRTNNPGQSTNFSALSYIDQSDIETMSILKDASATAIYGARGANGVVIITTKSGKVGKPRYNFNASTGVTNPTRKLDFLNGQEWFSLYQEARQNDGMPILGPNDAIRLNDNDNDSRIVLPVSQFANTNWVDQTLRSGFSRDANFNVSGGTEAQTYSINASVLQNEGILKGNQFDRYAVRANIANKGKYVDISYNNSLTYVKNKIVPVSFNPGGFGSAQSNSLPIFPIYNPDGSFFGASAAQSFNTGINPVAYAQNDFTQDVTRSLNMVRATINFLPYLKTSHSIQTDLTFLKERFYYSSLNRYSSSIGNNNAPAAQREKITPLAGLDERTVYAQNILTTHQIDFSKTFKEKHTFSATAGFEYNYVRQRDNGFFTQGNNFGYTRGQTGFRDDRQSINSGNIQWALNADSLRFNGSAVGGYNSVVYRAFNSGFSRINYDYEGKYLLEVSGRIDGVSNFGPNRRIAPFGAVAAGWIMSDEKFWEKVPFLNFSKIRVSYGGQGGPGYAANEWNGSYRNGGNYLGSPILEPNRIPNPDVSWSTVYQTDISWDYGFNKSKITGSITWFNRDTRDLHITRSFQQSAYGYAAQLYINDPEASIVNRGLEFALSSINMDGKLRWSTDFNITYLTNEVKSIGALGPDAINAGPGDARILEGYPQGVWYLAKFAGVDAQTGLEMIYDLEGNKIVASNDNVRNNRQAVGSPFPKFTGGISNNFTYKGFDAQILFSFSLGGQIYDDAAKRQIGGFSTIWNQRRTVLNRWQKPGDVTDVPKLTMNTTAGEWNNTTRWLYDADFLRLRTVQIGYTLPKTLTQRMKIEKLRIFVTGQNLATFTNYPGWDPEVTRVVESDPQVSNVSNGSPYLSTPQVRTTTIGVQLSF